MECSYFLERTNMDRLILGKNIDMDDSHLPPIKILALIAIISLNMLIPYFDYFLFILVAQNEHCNRAYIYEALHCMRQVGKI